MAQHTVLLLNETVPQIQEPQAGDSYIMPADTEIQGDLTISGTVDGRDIAADGALLDTAVQPGDNISGLTNDSGFTDDMTPNEIAVALFSESDTNNFTDSYKALLDAFTGPANQAQAEAGTATDVWMSPLRVAQAIAALTGSGFKHNWVAAVAPVVTNDTNDGYSPGSMWYDTVATTGYLCVDNTAGAAVWIQITAQKAAEIRSKINDVTGGITAFAGGGQGSATQLTTRFNEVATVATGGDSVKLPNAAANLQVTVVNNGANALDLFPASGDNIDGTGVDTAVSVAAGTSVTLWALDATNWYYA